LHLVEEAGTTWWYFGIIYAEGVALYESACTAGRKRVLTAMYELQIEKGFLLQFLECEFAAFFQKNSNHPQLFIYSGLPNPSTLVWRMHSSCDEHNIRWGLNFQQSQLLDANVDYKLTTSYGFSEFLLVTLVFCEFCSIKSFHERQFVYVWVPWFFEV